ncbi:MAG: hypothetical protein IKV67_13690, partial [Paludibacteraceae bacterium]|nr:hypothetical protein [Paludibacteraceae bacterium]
LQRIYKKEALLINITLMGKLTEHFGDLSLIDIVYADDEKNCAVLVLVAAGHIDGSKETQTDLLDKMEGYLNHIQSEKFKKDYPQENVYIDVCFDDIPDVLITDLLFECQNWVKENGAILRLKIGDDYVHFTN